jgi:hypothetical protein
MICFRKYEKWEVSLLEFFPAELAYLWLIVARILNKICEVG